MGTTFPSVDDVLEIHNMVIRHSGGASGVRNEDGIGAALERLKQTLFGSDAYPTLAGKAAAFFQTLIQRHPFVDGNKRTAVRTVYALLRINGRQLVATQDEVVEVARSTAAGDHDVDELSEWFEEHTEQPGEE
jgi:death-on-curing protein